MREQIEELAVLERLIAEWAVQPLLSDGTGENEGED